MLAVIYGLKQMAQDGLGCCPSCRSSAGLVLGLAFVRRQRRLADPLIDLRLFRVPAFSASLAVYTLGILVLFGSFLFVYQYLQLVLEPLAAHGRGVDAALVRRLRRRLDARADAREARAARVRDGRPGLAIAAVGLLDLTQVGAESGLGVLVVASVIYSLGIAPIFTLDERPHPRHRATRAGRRSLGDLGDGRRARRRALDRVLGTLGTAVYRTQVDDGIPAAVPADAAETARDTLGGAVAVSGDLAAGPADAAPRGSARGVRRGLSGGRAS